MIDGRLLLLPRRAHSGRTLLLIDERVLLRWEMIRRGDDGAQDADGSGATVDVKDGPKGQRDIDVHEQSGGTAVPHHSHFSIVREVEFNLITQDRSVGDILGDYPILWSVNRKNKNLVEALWERN